MLKELGLTDIEDLFLDIPQKIKIKDLNLPEGLSQQDTEQKLRQIVRKNKSYNDFLSFFCAIERIWLKITYLPLLFIYRLPLGIAVASISNKRNLIETICDPAQKSDVAVKDLEELVHKILVRKNQVYRSRFVRGIVILKDKDGNLGYRLIEDIR